jgi:hypothetical protein
MQEVHMTGLDLLWLPILVSAIVVFVASSLIHMLTPWHKGDYARLPNEDAAMDALRSLRLEPGDYMVPRATSRQEMSSEAYAAKVKKGPVLIMSVWPNEMAAMGKTFVLWFLYLIVVGIFSAYVTGRALPAGAHYLAVFRFAGVTAFIGYAVAQWQMSIWFRRPWLTTFKSTVDGLIYGLLTAGVFGWLWPQ